MKYIDLHTHTYYSDGGLSPTELVEKAKEVRLSAIAITDHDTIKGVEEAKQAGEKLGVEVIAGCEISTDLNEKDLHILGYFVETRNPELQNLLNSEEEQREQKARKMIKGFQEIGYRLDYDQIRASTKGSIGRPHLAMALITNPENKQKLFEDFGAGVIETQAIFEKYLGGECEFYQRYASTRISVTTQKGIEVVHRAGGLAFLAHPAWDFTEITDNQISFVGDKEIREIRDFGLDGIEAITFRQDFETSQKIVAHYTQLAKDLDLLISGGSDFHGYGSAGKSLGLSEENMLIDHQILSGIKAKLSVV